MDKIRSAIKCAICREILKSPVILPCTDIVCKKHVSIQTKDVIRCEKCGVEHVIPANGFLSVPSIEEIIKSNIVQLDFGSLHKGASKSCESFEDALKEFRLLLNDPCFYTSGKIDPLKNTVQLKGEELKLRIDEEMKKLIGRLEEYENRLKEYLSSNEFKEESDKLESEMKNAQSNLDSWIESLNK